MSRILVLFLFVLVSCAGEAPETTSIGVKKYFEPLQVSQEDDYRFQMICAALDAKSEALRIMASASYTFSYSDKGCNEDSLKTPKEIKTKIIPSGSSYMFQMENNEAFYFPYVELSNEGLMAEICKNAGRITTPVQTSRTSAMWFSLGMDTNECESDDNGVCIYFQRGTVDKDDPNAYIIHTEEWIKFKMLNPNRGFFTERKVRSSANCSEGKTYEKKALLK